MSSIEHVKDTDSLKVFLLMDYSLFLKDYQTIDDDRDLSRYSDRESFPVTFINNYIRAKLKIAVNNKELSGKLLQTDRSGSDIIFWFFYRCDRKPRSLTIGNNILMSLYSDQVNMTIIRIGDYEEGIKFTHDNTEATIRL
jgi:hypothetical protein